MQIIKDLNIDFIGKRRRFFAIPVILFIVLLSVYIFKGGPNYSIDFTGGIMMQVSFDNQVEMEDVRRAVIDAGISSFELQKSENTYILRAKRDIGEQKTFEDKITDAFHSAFPSNKMTVEKMEFVGPVVGEYLSKQALYAFCFAFLGIIVYVAFRFKSSLWGVVSIVGIINDVALSFGFIVLTNKEIDITVIAALLTIAGYSINDTIVLFDRMRENLRLYIKDDFATIINRSINSILLRSIVTSVTVFIVACALFFLGGEVIHTFAYVMVIGTVLGVYSSIFICAPLVYEYETRKRKRLKVAKKQGKLS
ncbi:MAG: protein translocase subunit SecF [Elusimicrobiota bacterium]|nr:protein translocase subunit SecF [Elusimicrobiota bacterium]